MNSPPLPTRLDHTTVISDSRTNHHDDSNEDYQVDGLSDDINPKNVKSSADSGLGSTEVVNEQQHWRNGIQVTIRLFYTQHELSP